MSPAASLRVTARHVQLLRALFAAIAALMITFSPDHSAEVGLSVLGGFGIATGFVFALAAWLVAPAGHRGSSALLAAVYLVAGMTASVTALRSELLFFAAVIVWALVAGAVELLVGIVQRSRLGRADARDAIVVGALTILLGLAVLIVPTDYALDYFIEDAGRTFTLTGTTIAVGLLGGYAAIVAVYLGIAGFSPQPATETAAGPDARTDTADDTASAATAQEDRP
ncbi:acyl-CoA synthetase [Microbacterium sp. NPDC096154]|uniref:acyl-CoA synthetase n=1 Tax=Microbacterium sp. NPDC096154 TaxID=3155549 RepID=UPI003325D0C3